jgi:hypothetical protein
MRPSRGAYGSTRPSGTLSTMLRFSLSLTFLLAMAGCLEATLPQWDEDGDGHAATGERPDCAPLDPAIHPDAVDAHGDQVDQNCDGVDGEDRDGDGFAGNGDAAAPTHDCDDLDPAVFPGAGEAINRQDDDCDGEVDEDTAAADDDGDGYCEGIDTDDDGQPDCSDEGLPGDCDDADPSIHPAAEDACGDGVDVNCDPSEELDGDGDEFAPCEGDCDDTDPTSAPGHAEQCDEVDHDCDGASNNGTDSDDDGDGHTECGGDCDDVDVLRRDGFEEVCDGLDNDCDQVVPDDETDPDDDGALACAGDCDDEDAFTGPAATDTCDGVVADCEPTNDWDCVICDSWLAPTESLSEAITALSPSQPWTLCLEPGSYAGPISTAGRAVWLLGAAGPGATRMIGDGTTSTLSITAGEGADTLVQGLTITGGGGSTGGGLHVQNADPILRDLVVEGNMAWDGGGLRLTLSSALLDGLIVRSNEALEHGGGAYIDGGAPILQDVTIDDNSADADHNSLGDGGGLYVDGSAMQIVRSSRSNRICGNGASRGGGMALRGAGDVLVESTILCENRSGEVGGGMDAEGAGLTLALNNVQLVDNTADTLGGGGARIAVAAASFQHVVVAGNRAQRLLSQEAEGGGLWLHDGEATYALTNVILAGNSSENDGGAVVQQRTEVDYSHVAMVGNSALDWSGGLDTWSDGLNSGQGGAEGTLRSSIVAGNSAFTGFGGLSLWGGPWSSGWTHCDGNRSDEGDVNYGSLQGFTLVAPWLDGSVGFAQDGIEGVPDAWDWTATPERWDLRLDPASPLIDAGEDGTLDPDGSPADVGPFGGPGADGWDLDGDGFFAWWRPGPYDASIDPTADCDDLDPTVNPGQGC